MNCAGAKPVSALAMAATWLALASCSSPASPPVGQADSSDAATLADAGKVYPGPPLPQEQFRDTLLDRYCQAAVSCPVLGEALYGTVGGCRALSNANWPFLNWLALAPTDPYITYNALAARACVDAIKACDVRVSVWQFELPAVCWEVVSGSQPVGAPCTVARDCASGACTATTERCPGKCDQDNPGGQGCTAKTGEGTSYATTCWTPNTAEKTTVATPCGTPCPEGQFCDTDTMSCSPIPKIGQPCTFWCEKAAYCDGVCKPFSKVGAACTCVNANCWTCEGGALCVTADPSQPGTCVVPKAGDECNWMRGAIQNACGANLVCADVAGSAGACLPPATVGQPCQVDDQCAGHDLHCAGSAAGKGTCAGPADKGEACKPPGLKGGYLLPCKPPLQCVAGVCGDPPALGQACNPLVNPPCAAGLVCNRAAPEAMGTCAKGHAVGESCTPLADACADGLQCAYAKCTAIAPPACPMAP